jgi:hypothetical protein
MSYYPGMNYHEPHRETSGERKRKRKKKKKRRVRAFARRINSPSTGLALCSSVSSTTVSGLALSRRLSSLSKRSRLWARLCAWADGGAIFFLFSSFVVFFRVDVFTKTRIWLSQGRCLFFKLFAKFLKRDCCLQVFAEKGFHVDG